MMMDVIQGNSECSIRKVGDQFVLLDDEQTSSAGSEPEVAVAFVAVRPAEAAGSLAKPLGGQQMK